ncbi:hypothetical protein EDB19DRAFT_1696863 [Suillus lakei]|nr:hypothetical protein EDB19DRAFT_1696863 [Suillus lakei]
MPTTVSPTRDVICILVLPPVAVVFHDVVLPDFWINICLTILGWIPGVLHAWYLISRSEGAM